jgi:Na+/melibiose symporter-like transporter
MLLYGAGGIAGGLVFTMMNNALPLMLMGYTMPTGLPEFFAPGQPVPAQIVALLTNERSLFGGLVQPLIGAISDRTHSPIGKRSPFILAGGISTGLAISLLALQPPFWWLLALVTFAGLALYVAVGPYVALLADITPPRQRGRVGGLMAIGGVVGAVAFTVMSTLLWESARGWVFVITGLGVA